MNTITRLHYYAQSGRLDQLKSLLESTTISLNTPNPYGSTIFYEACENQRLEIVKYLLKFDQLDPNTTNILGDTPLIGACLQNNVTLVRMLIADRRVKLNQRNKYGNTALFVSVWFRRLDIVKILLADGRDLGWDHPGQYWGTNEHSFAYSGLWRGKNNSHVRYCGSTEITALALAKFDHNHEDDTSELVNLLERFVKDPEKVRMELRQ